MADNENPLSAILGAGVRVAGAWADKKLYGSQRGGPAVIDENRAEYNRINGSGAVNQSAAFSRPQTWTQFFFGSGGTTGDAAAGGRPPWGLLLVAAAVGAWLFFRKP